MLSDIPNEDFILYKLLHGVSCINYVIFSFVGIVHHLFENLKNIPSRNELYTHSHKTVFLGIQFNGYRFNQIWALKTNNKGDAFPTIFLSRFYGVLITTNCKRCS